MVIVVAASLASDEFLPFVPAWPALQPLLAACYSQVQYLGLYYAVAGRPTAQALSIEMAVFLSVLWANTAWCLMPAANPNRGNEVESFVPLRRHLTPDHGGRGISSATDAPSTISSTITALQFFSRGRPFCLELACNMLEASYQTYFHEGDQVQTIGQSINPKVDLKRLGLDPWGVMACNQHCTFGFIGLNEQEMVVAFRGSTMANILSDMKVAQVPLPSLPKSKDFFMRALYGYTTPYSSLPRPNEYGSISNTYPLRDKPEDIAGERSLRERAWAITARCIELLPLCKQTLPRVHLGFWQSYASLRDEFLILIARAMRNQSQPGSFAPPIVRLTGHSLGAAMAVLASLDLAANLPVISEAIQSRPAMPGAAHCDLRSVSISVTCFGCPRVGNAAFMTMYNGQIPDCFRVEVDGDLVTMVPKILGFYRHVGKTVLLDELATGNIVVQPSVLEQSLFRRSIGTLGNHSLEKYRQCLEACFEPEELSEYLATEQTMIAMASTPSSASSTSLPVKADGFEPSAGNPFLE